MQHRLKAHSYKKEQKKLLAEAVGLVNSAAPKRDSDD
jgi:hypothetical protein